MKQITITVPDNCELKQDGNTYIIIEKEKKLTYEDVAKELFEKNDVFYINANGDINNINVGEGAYSDLNNCTSRRQAKKLLAINKLMNVAKYLNGDWQPDWNDATEFKYYLMIKDDGIKIAYVGDIYCTDIYFKSKELIQQAIEILGEDVIKLALCTDY